MQRCNVQFAAAMRISIMKCVHPYHATRHGLKKEKGKQSKKSKRNKKVLKRQSRSKQQDIIKAQTGEGCNNRLVITMMYNQNVINLLYLLQKIFLQWNRFVMHAVFPFRARCTRSQPASQVVQTFASSCATSLAMVTIYCWYWTHKLIIRQTLINHLSWQPRQVNLFVGIFITTFFLVVAKFRLSQQYTFGCAKLLLRQQHFLKHLKSFSHKCQPNRVAVG